MIIPLISTLTKQRDRLQDGYSTLINEREMCAVADTLTAIIEALQSPEGVEELLARHEQETQTLKPFPSERAFHAHATRQASELLSLARALTIKVAAAEELADALRDSSLDKIMAMSDEKITALCRLEGRDPADIATLAKKSLEIAALRVNLKAAESLAQRERERADEAMRLLAEAVVQIKELHPIMDEFEPCCVYDIWVKARAFLAKGAPHG